MTVEDLTVIVVDLLIVVAFYAIAFPLGSWAASRDEEPFYWTVLLLVLVVVLVLSVLAVLTMFSVGMHIYTG